MTNLWTRRELLAALAAAPLAAKQSADPSAPGATPQPPKPAPLLDIHIHLFGAGDGGSGCRIAESLKKSAMFQYLAGKFGKSTGAKSLDEAYVQLLFGQLRSSGLDKGVILAQDAVYDRLGKPDWDRTPFYVPNDYVFQVATRDPQRIIPCVSINPDRADALEELDRCAKLGARVLKIHAPIQGVDVADKKHAKFFQHCADKRVLVMVHTGHEHSAPVVNIDLADPRRLRLALDQGCTVVACHCGTGWMTDKPDLLPAFFEMLQQHPNLWGDTSILGTVGRVRDVGRLLAHKPALERLVHGSDFPFPSQPVAFAPLVGWKGLGQLRRVQAMANLLAQDLALKDLLGMGRGCAERAHRLVLGSAGKVEAK